MSGANPLVLGTEEQKQLGGEVSALELRAAGVVIKTDIDYANAGELAKQVKSMTKKVEEYWEPMRKSTYDAYQAVMTKKKAMLKPMQAAEKIIKSKMSAFSIEQERKRKQQEEELRRQAREEMERKLDMAAEAERNGDLAAAEYAMAEAEVMEDMAIGAMVQQPSQKVDGVSKSKTWKIVSIDKGQVPISIAGVELRPVDETAVMRLIKGSKGQIEIPGIKYEETYTISVRA